MQATHMTTKTLFACLFLTAAVMAASTPDEVVRETEFVSVVSEMSVGDEDMHEEARTQVSSLLESGKTKDACASLAANMIKTVNDNAKNIQKALDALDMGKNCDQAGLKAYTDAQTAEGKAKKKNDDAVKAKSKADNTPLAVTVPLDTLKAPSTCSAVYATAAYKDAKSASDTADREADKAKGEYTQAKKATKAAKKAHEDAKLACACQAQKTHKSGVDMSKKVKSSENQKSWSKGHHMQCVLSGKTAAQCKVPALPTVSVPGMPSWVSKTECRLFGPNRYITANKGGWGGACTCPDGQVYQVGDNMNGCGSLACFGGKSGTCHRRNGSWSKKQVTCGIVTGHIGDGCSKCVSNFADCSAACSAAMKVPATGTCAHPGSTNPSKCCSCTKKPIKVCSMENQPCKCDGRVVFGRRYAGGKPGNGAAATYKQMIAAGHLSKEVRGTITCSIAEFGKDPFPYHYKQCTCQQK
jgi:hypothetical protein